MESGDNHVLTSVSLLQCECKFNFRVILFLFFRSSVVGLIEFNVYFIWRIACGRDNLVLTSWGVLTIYCYVVNYLRLND